MEWRLFADLAEVAGADRVELDVEPDATVEDALAALLADRPDLHDRVLTEDGDLRSHINVLREGDPVESMAESVEDGDELALFPPVSGG